MQKVSWVLAVASVVGLAQASFAAQSSYSSLVTAKNPLSYYQLDETSGTSAADTGSNAVNGTYSTDASFSLGQPSASSVLNTAIKETATGTAPTPVTANLGTGANSPGSIGANAPATFELWFNNAVLANTREDILDMNAGANNTGSDFGIHIIGDGTAGNNRLRIFHGTDIVPAASGPVVSLNAWHYLVYTRDAAGNAVLYYDGTQAATGTDTASFASFSSLVPGTLLGIGGKTVSNNRTFAGLIDEVAIYGSQLSASDVAAHYAAGAPVPEPASLALLGLGGVGLLARRRRSA